MVWVEKRAKDADANLKKSGGRWHVRVKLALPGGQTFDKIGTAATKPEARAVRDDLFAAYNHQARQIISEIAVRDERAEAGMTLRELAIKCRDEWWPAKGRSADTAEQYFQKIEDYAYPVLGPDKPIREIGSEDWDAVLAFLHTKTGHGKKPLTEATIRKMKACLSSASPAR